MLIYLCSLIEDSQDKIRFTELYYKHHVMMEKVSLKILKNSSDAEDAVQNAFIQVIRHFEKTLSIPCEELQFWLISIVKNEALTILRKKHPSQPFEDWEAFSNTTDDVSNYNALVALFQKLPPSYRSVLEMKLLLGYTDKEIAAHLGISETAVSSRASRGRALFREILTTEGIQP